MSACVGTVVSLRGAATLSMGITDHGWLARFHGGDRSALEECYRENYAAVDRAVGRLLRGPDKETVIHELFFRLLTRPELRQGYTGGSMAAWLQTLARNQAIDLLRRRQRDVPLDAADLPDSAQALPDDDLDAKKLVSQFKAEILPEAWASVFQTRFIEQLNQREAASKLGLSRTTLAYRELRIRAMLRKFLLRDGGDR